VGFCFDKMTNFHRLAGNQMENITGYVNFGASGYTLSSFVNDALATPPTINTTSNLGIGSWDYYGHNIQIPISQKTAIAYRKSLPTQEAVWVLSFGINDLILNSSNGNLTEAQIITYLTGHLNTAIAKFKSECPDDKVILRIPNTMSARPYSSGAGFPSPTEYPTFGVDKPTDVALVTKWNTAIRKAYLKVSQENLNTMLFDTHKKVFELELSAEIDANLRPNMGDLVHPNSAGYISIADELAYIFKDTRVNKQETANLEAEKRAILLVNNAWENNAEYLFKKEKFNLVLSNNSLIVGGASNFLDLPYALTDFNNATKGLPIYVKSGNVAYKITSYSAVASASNTRLLGISIPAKLYNSKAELSIFMDAFDRNTFVDISTAQTVSGIKTLASPIFTGNPTAPTPTLGDNDTSVATSAFVQSAVTSNISQTITNGVTTSAPSQDAVFDALALKANVNFPATFTGSAVSAPLGFIGDSFTTGSTGGGLFAPNNGPISFTANNPGTPGWASNTNITATFYKTTVYTVATLPTTGVTTGTYATVSDALSPSYMATVVGGGAVVTPVFYNGANWVAH
jgi:lysophospholipase L1-like esterase